MIWNIYFDKESFSIAENTIGKSETLRNPRNKNDFLASYKELSFIMSFWVMCAEYYHLTIITKFATPTSVDMLNFLVILMTWTP